MATPTFSGHALNTTTNHLLATLQQAKRADGRVKFGRAVFRMLTWLLLAAFIAIALDAVLSLPPLFRLAVDIAFVLFALVLVIKLIAITTRQVDDRAAARLMEQQLDLTSSQLINAVDIANESSPGRSESLSASTIQVGDRLAATVDASKAISRAPFKQAAFRFAGLAASVAMVYLLLPAIFHSVLPRYLQPFTDNPAYTLIEFDVDYPQEIIQGKPVVIKATISGLNLPERASVVFLADPSEPNALARQNMIRLADTAATHSKKQLTALDTPLAFALRLDRADRTTSFYIDTPTGRSKTFTLKVRPVPQIEQVTIKYDPPAYTGWSSETESLSASGIRGLIGTQVTVQVKSNMALREGRLEISPARDQSSAPTKDGPSASIVSLQPDPVTPNVATGTFTLGKDGEFRLTLFADNAEGTPTDQPRTGTIRVYPDRPPTVAITEPANTIIIAPEDWTIPVIVQAEDDVQLASLQLFVQHNDLPGRHVNLAYDKTQRLIEVRHGINLESLNAKAGDKVMFFATAVDNYSKSPQSADSKRHVIHVISLEEYLDHARSKYQMSNIEDEIEAFQKQLDAIEKQRKAIEATLIELQAKIDDNNGKTTPEDLEQLTKLGGQLDEYAQDQLRLSQEMRRRAAQPSLYDFEDAFKDMLKTHGDHLDRSANDLIEQRQQYDKHRRDQPNDSEEAERHIESLLEQLKLDEGEQQQAAKDANASKQDTQRIAAADRLAALVQRIVRVIEQQRDLADRFAPFKEKSSLSTAEQLRAQRLAHEQTALKEDLEVALNRIEKEATAAQNTLPRMAASAAEIAESIRKLDVLADQAKAEESAIGGNGETAHAAAASAATKLESLQADTEEIEDAAAADMADTPLSLSKMKLGDSLKQLARGRGLATSSTTPNDSQGGKSGSSRGARADVSVYGPHAAGNDSTKAKPGGNPDGTGQGGVRSPNGTNNATAENLTPADSRTHRAAAPGVRGVPAPYQEIADQYLRRLAEDSK